MVDTQRAEEVERTGAVTQNGNGAACGITSPLKTRGGANGGMAVCNGNNERTGRTMVVYGRKSGGRGSSVQWGIMHA